MNSHAIIDVRWIILVRWQHFIDDIIVVICFGIIAGIRSLIPIEVIRPTLPSLTVPVDF